MDGARQSGSALRGAPAQGLRERLTSLTPEKAFALVAALLIIILSTALLWGKLADLILREPDIFVGALLGLAGFLISYGLSRDVRQLELERVRDLVRDGQHEDIDEAVIKRAKELIAERDARFSAVMESQFDTRTNEKGYRRLSALLNRNIAAATTRLGEYFDAQATDHQFHRRIDKLITIMHDLDQAKSNAEELAAGLGFPKDVRDPKIGAARATLVTICRDLTEAFNRRNDVYAVVRQHPMLWTSVENLFSVMTSDIAKARITIQELLSLTQRNDDLHTHLRSAVQYVTAALRRAQVIVQRSHEIKDIGYSNYMPLPDTFGVMVMDLQAASNQLLELLFKHNDGTDSLQELQRELKSPTGTYADPKVEERRKLLRPILRSLVEGQNRFSEFCKSAGERDLSDERIVAVVAIIASDIDKANQLSKTAFMDLTLDHEFAADIITVNGYVEAAVSRVEELKLLLVAGGCSLPVSFDVMEKDLRDAVDRLRMLIQVEQMTPPEPSITIYES